MRTHAVRGQLERRELEHQIVTLRLRDVALRDSSPSPVCSLSREAAQHLQSDLDGRMLRIAFTTACGGSGYRLSYADRPNDGDTLVAVGPVRVALDDMAASRLDGAVIEYDPDEDGFVLDHPDAVSAVWCG